MTVGWSRRSKIVPPKRLDYPNNQPVDISSCIARPSHWQQTIKKSKKCKTTLALPDLSEHESQIGIASKGAGSQVGTNLQLVIIFSLTSKKLLYV